MIILGRLFRYGKWLASAAFIACKESYGLVVYPIDGFKPSLVSAFANTAYPRWTAAHSFLPGGNFGIEGRVGRGRTPSFSRNKAHTQCSQDHGLSSRLVRAIKDRCIRR